MDSKLFVLLMLVLVQIKAQTYIVIVPNQVRPFTDLKISVQYLKPVSMETVTAELLDRNDGKIIMSNAVGHATEETPTILLPLPIPSIPQNIYRPCVRVNGSGSFPFNHQTCMYVTRQATSIMVQTDKAIYKPSDTVKYTIFAIDGSLDVVKVYINLAIYDPKGNKLDEKNELFTNPTVDGEFVLSDMTTLGSWRIVAEPIGIVFRTTAKQETVVSNGQQINNKRKQCDRMKSRDMRRADKCYRKLLQMMRKFVLVDTTAKIVKTQDKRTLQMSAKTQYFRVDEYVLPKFEVIMTLPKYSLTTDESLTVTVQARYTFDQAVKGYVVLTLSRGYSYYRYHYYSLRLFDLKAVERKKEIDGEVTFNIPVKLLSRLTRSFQHSSVSIVASVTDSVSGEMLSQSGSVTFYKNPYQISFHPSMPANFKPGFPFPVMVKVSYPDGTPVTRGQVKVTETYFRVTALNDTVPDEIKFKGYSAESPFAEGQTVMIKTKTFKLRNDGIVFIKDLKIPKAVTTGNIKAQFKDVRVYKDLSRFQSPNNYLLKVEQVDLGQREVKDRAVFILKSNVQPVTGRYLVVSKNNIVAQGAFEISDPDYMATSIVILMTRDMAPSAHLVAYYVLNGVIVADGLKLSVENIYENKVSVEFDQSKTVQPKTSVKVKVTADVSSTVSVLVVDKSVRLLQKGNEITQDRVENELRKYGNFPIFYYPGWRYYPWSFPADDSYAIFYEAKLATFTDAFLYNFDLHSLAKSVLPEVPIGYVPDSPSFARQEDMVLEAAPCEGPGCADSTEPSGQVRTEFPEAWICASQIVGDSGVAEFTAQAPDTITTWVASAFALHKDSGLGVAPIFANLTTFLPFFVVLQLPYSAVQNEVVVLEASVFNYYQETLNVLVTFRNDGWYEGIMFDEDGNEMPINATDDLQKCVLVEPNSPTPVFFVFKPLKSGLMPINVRIEEFKRNIFDEVLKHLLVKAEGEEISENHAILISHNTTITTNRSTKIKYPTHVVPGSEKIRVSVFGDIFGLTLKHLDRLIQMPYGCGEQNMVRFAPAVYATSYLGATDRYHYNKGLQDWIKKVLMTGIQRELLYRRNDNSFSAFGNADREGSLWLTTFVAKCFTQAAKLGVVPVDKQVIEKAAEYIVKQQDPTGFFRDRGHVHHKAMQGGTIGSRGSLTAYVLSTFREMMDGYEFQDESIFNTVSSAMKLAISYLNEIVEDDPIPDFEAAIGAYVNPANMAFLQALENSENKSTDGGLHWKSRSRALEIEIASYAMLAYIQQNDILTAVEILEWQVKQRNSFGGYRSTQDTVVALQALSEIAKLIYQKETMMDVSVFTTRNSIESPTAEFELNQLNQDVLQFNDFDGPVDTVEVGVEGKGLAMIDVSSFYNVFVEPQPPSYILTVEPYDDSPEQFKLKACTRFIIPDAQSNMAIMSVGVPSGFEASMVGISAILNGTEYVKRVERSGDRISIYFDEIPSSTICIHIKVVRKFNIAGLKRANVLVYSYYETDERAMVDYMPDALNDIKVCDAGGICGISNQELPLEQCNASPTSPP